MKTKLILRWLTVKARMRWAIALILWRLLVRVLGGGTIGRLPVPVKSQWSGYDDMQDALVSLLAPWKNRQERAQVRATRYENRVSTLSARMLNDDERWDMGFQRGYAAAMNDACEDTIRLIETRGRINDLVERVS